MKILSTCLIAATALCVSAATLIKDGKPLATIHVNVPISDEGVPFNDRVADKLTEEELAKQTMRTAVDDLNYHFKKMSGTNSHHIIEAAFKAFGRIMNTATSIDQKHVGEIPSTKGVL